MLHPRAGWRNNGQFCPYSFSPVERLKTAQNAAKSVLKIKLLSGPWQLGSFPDLAVQVLGWWATATTPVTRDNLEPLELCPGRSTSSQDCASWKDSSPNEFPVSQFTAIAAYKILNLPCRWNMKPNQRRVGLSWFLPGRAESILRPPRLKWDRDSWR